MSTKGCFCPQVQPGNERNTAQFTLPANGVSLSLARLTLWMGQFFGWYGGGVGRTCGDVLSIVGSLAASAPYPLDVSSAIHPLL